MLLRPITSTFDAETDDIDLLLTEQERSLLLQAAFAEAAAGRMHVTICQRTSEKIQLVLWSLSTSQRLVVDLWSVFSQLPQHPEMMIRAEQLMNFVGSAGSGLAGAGQLTPDVDLCLLVLHLVKKNRPLHSAAVRERICRASDRLAASIPELFSTGTPTTELTSLIEFSERLRRTVLRRQEATLPRTPETRSFGDVVSHAQAKAIESCTAETDCSLALWSQSLLVAENYLLGRLRRHTSSAVGNILQSRKKRNVFTEFRRWVMKRVSCVAVVGSDGAGKSSVCESVTRQQPAGFVPIVAKKLYRRSWLYQLVSGAAKKITHADRGRFDDIAAPIVTLRASLSLWVRFCFRGLIPRRPRTLLLDRSLGSFLIVQRKSSAPRPTRLTAWLEGILPPVTTVLLVLPFRDLVRRKTEFRSAAGHARYQQLLFEQALRQRPCELIVIANTGSPDDAAAAINALRSSPPSHRSSPPSLRSSSFVTHVPEALPPIPCPAPAPKATIGERAAA